MHVWGEFTQIQVLGGSGAFSMSQGTNSNVVALQSSRQLEALRLPASVWSWLLLPASRRLAGAGAAGGGGHACPRLRTCFPDTCLRTCTSHASIYQRHPVQHFFIYYQRHPVQHFLLFINATSSNTELTVDDKDRPAGQPICTSIPISAHMSIASVRAFTPCTAKW